MQAVFTESLQAGIPLTGDMSGMILPLMGGLLGISGVLFVIYVVLSKRKK